MKLSVSKYIIESKMLAEGISAVEVIHKDMVLHRFCIQAAYENALIKVLCEHTDLIEGSRYINLFEEESLSDHIPNEWLFANHVCDDVDPRWIDEVGKIGGSASNETLLQLLQDRFHLSPEAYRTVIVSIDQIREASGVKRSSAVDIDGFIAEAGSSFLSEVFGIKKQDIARLAFESGNHNVFKREMVSSDASVRKESVFVLDGFRAVFNVLDNGFSMRVEYASICLMYQGYDIDSASDYITLFSLSGEQFWHDIWYELYGQHREHLIFMEEEEKRKLEEKIRILEQKLKRDIHAQGGRGGESSYPQIAEAYEKVFGKRYSNQTLSNITKKALDKIRAYVEQKGYSIEEYLCA